jgi:hypothetical protein
LILTFLFIVARFLRVTGIYIILCIKGLAKRLKQQLTSRFSWL